MDKKLRKACADLLLDIITTPTKHLMREVKDQDLKDKQELIKEIETFKSIYKKNKDIKIKEIIIALTQELEETNGRIERIKKEINEK